MLNLAAAKIWLCIEPTDMRKSFDTLAARVREHLRADPMSGSWYVFRGLRGDRLKILYWDGDGFALWQKRLAKGADLALILGGVALNAKRRMRYTRVAAMAVAS